MKINKFRFSTQLGELYGRDKYQSHIEVNRDYWYFFPDDSDIFRATHENWNKIRITYVRSGCLFYVFPDAPLVEEKFCPVNCFMTSQFVLAELDPVKDLSGSIKNINTDTARMEYCFDDERTIVKNWPNEKTVDVDEEKLFKEIGGTGEWLLIKTMEVK